MWVLRPGNRRPKTISCQIFICLNNTQHIHQAIRSQIAFLLDIHLVESIHQAVYMSIVKLQGLLQVNSAVIQIIAQVTVDIVRTHHTIIHLIETIN